MKKNIIKISKAKEKHGICHVFLLDMEESMNLIDELGLNLGKSQLITLVGAGGKTSIMFELAREISSKGKSVLVTTTTAIFYPENNSYDKILITDVENLDIIIPENGKICVLGSRVTNENKLLGISKSFTDSIYINSIFDFILVEGDGSRRLPIKAPAEHEPVIPKHTSVTIGVVGLDSLGRRINNGSVHRPDIFCSITKMNMNDIIDDSCLVKLIFDPNGLFKSAPENSTRYLILNKADNDILRSKGKFIKDIILKNTAMKIDKVLVTNMKKIIEDW